ncbi:hypothetical protein [Streptomyces chrestomyceticus]|uniref:hypothetical protein n=1 Tax=Streptomyces chrestomyceticus TaxID=68185 RepID=UPI0033D61E5D
MTLTPEQALEAASQARNAELAVRIGNKARATLAHERTALAALAAADAGVSHRDIGAKLGISHVAVGTLVTEARALPSVPEGRAGRGPLHVAMRYAAGEIDRDTLVDALATWPYASAGALTEGLHDDGAALTVPGTFDEVYDALVYGYFTEDEYDAILRRRAEQQ